MIDDRLDLSDRYERRYSLVHDLKRLDLWIRSDSKPNGRCSTSLSEGSEIPIAVSLTVLNVPGALVEPFYDLIHLGHRGTALGNVRAVEHPDRG